MGRSSITLNGSIRTGHPKEILEYGFLFGSTSDLSGPDTRTLKVSRGSLYFFSADVDNLDYGATYYYAVYAENGFERLLSETKAVTIDKASVILSDFEQVNNTRSCFSAHVADDGGGDIRRVGFCWSDEEKEPTIYEGEFLVAELDPKTKSFELSLPLEPTKIYYVRAFVQSRITEEESLTDAYSETIIVVPGPADNEIWYTSTDEEVISLPPVKSAFNATLVSNIYENGRGVITFNAPVTTIGEGAFEKCSNLLTLTIPDYIETIEPAVFSECINLKKFMGKYSSADGRLLVVDGRIVAFAPAGLKEYDIPENINSIGEWAFFTSRELESLKIHENVNQIGKAAFVGCSALRDVYCYSVTPPTIEDTIFEWTSSALRIYVPEKSLSLYKRTDGWSYFEDIIFSIEDNNDLNKIYYTSTNGEIVTPSLEYAFGASLLSNKYENGRGVLTFNENVADVGGLAFRNCKTLKSIIIPNRVNVIGQQAFSECTNLEEIVIGENVREIGLSAFENCKKLKNIKIPNSVSFIDVAAFQSSGLVSVILGDGLTAMGNGVFMGCADLQEVNIGFGLSVIPYRTFYNCTSLKRVIIPSTIEEIAGYAFEGCSSLDNVELSDGVMLINNYAFYGCTNLETITIPESLKNVGFNPFLECVNLSEFKGAHISNDGRCLIIDDCLKSFAPAGLKEYTIPDVQTISSGAFNRCIELEIVTIPESVNSIKTGAFNRAEQLSCVYCLATIPPKAVIDETLWNAFNNNAPGRKIFVPAESVEAYKTAPYWSDYAADIYPIGGEEEPKPEEDFTLQFEVSPDVTSALVSVTPSTDDFYCWDCLKKEDYELYAQVYGSIDNYQVSWLQLLADAYGYPLSLLLTTIATSGVNEGVIEVDGGFNPFEPDTEYVLFGYKMDMETGEALSSVSTSEFKTLPLLEGEFALLLDVIPNSTSAIISITPSTDDYFYYDCMDAGTYDLYVGIYGSVVSPMVSSFQKKADRKGVSLPEYLESIAYSGEIIDLLLERPYGATAFDPNTEYVLFGYQLDMETGNALSEISTTRFTTLSEDPTSVLGMPKTKNGVSSASQLLHNLNMRSNRF